MRIAIDARTICDRVGGPGAGIEHFTWSSILALIRRFPEHHYLLFVPRAMPIDYRGLLRVACPNVRLVSSDLPPGPFLARHIVLPLIAHFWRADILYVPTSHLPLLWKGPSVVTVHDTAIFDHPEWFPNADAKGFSTAKLVPRAIQKADGIIAVSAYTQERLEARFPERRGAVDVVYPGVDGPRRFSDSFQPPAEEYLLFLGTVEPRKNVSAALRAFDAFLRDHPERAPRTRFVIAGRWGWKTKETKATMDEINDAWQGNIGEPLVQAIGPVSEEDKWALLAHAAAFVFPSLDEGFGIPPLEAMAAGVPVICSNRGALPEVTGDAALRFAPDDEQTLSLLIAQCLLMPDAVKELRAVGQAQAALFTWEQTADGIMDSLIRTHAARKQKTSSR